MRLGDLVIRREPRDTFGVPVWVVTDGVYLYIHENVLGLVWMLVTEWRLDRHLVG